MIFITNQSRFGTSGSGIAEVRSTFENETFGVEELIYDDIISVRETKLENVSNIINMIVSNTNLGEKFDSEVIDMIETKLESVNNATNRSASKSIPTDVIINNLESLKRNLDSFLGGLAEDDIITDRIDQLNIYSEIDTVSDILKGDSCLWDNYVVLDKNPNETLVFSAD